MPTPTDDGREYERTRTYGRPSSSSFPEETRKYVFDRTRPATTAAETPTETDRGPANPSGS